jgi:biofilm protein TabA
MILDRLENAARYTALHPGLAAAFAALADPATHTLPAGKHPLDGERLALVVDQKAGRGQAGARLEAHRRYIDVQFAVAGTDLMGWKTTRHCRDLTTPYDATRDIEFYGDVPDAWFALPVGTFAIFFPEDAHAPLAGDGDLHKLIVKIAVEWE